MEGRSKTLTSASSQRLWLLKQDSSKRTQHNISKSNWRRPMGMRLTPRLKHWLHVFESSASAVEENSTREWRDGHDMQQYDLVTALGRLKGLSLSGWKGATLDHQDSHSETKSSCREHKSRACCTSFLAGIKSDVRNGINSFYCLR